MFRGVNPANCLIKVDFTNFAKRANLFSSHLVQLKISHEKNELHIMYSSVNNDFSLCKPPCSM